MRNEYDDIISLPHHVSKRHPQMSMLNRAAQFAPFAALTGFDASINESRRLTDDWIEQGADENDLLNRKMEQIVSMLPEHPLVTIDYFVPDEYKSGGAYQTVTGNVKRIDEYERLIELTNGMKIPIQNITEIIVSPLEKDPRQCN